MVESVGAGHDKFKIIPIFFDEVFQRILTGLQSSRKLLPEEFRIFPGLHRVNVYPIAHFVQQGLDIQRINGLGKLNGHKSRDQDSVDLPSRVGGGLIDDDAFLVEFSEFIPESVLFEIKKIREAERISVLLYICKSKNAMHARIGSGHEICPADR